MKNINGFRLNKNGKPILRDSNEISFAEDRGASFKDNGQYYFFLRKLRGKFIYTT